MTTESVTEKNIKEGRNQSGQSMTQNQSENYEGFKK